MENNMPKPTRTPEGALGIALKIVLMDLNEIRIATLIEAYVNERIAALQSPAGEWWSMESAPKDGTEILIYRDGWDYALKAKWAEYSGNPVEGVPDNPQEDGDDRAWMYGWLFDDMARIPCTEEGFLGWNEDEADGNMPTHWLPLPPAPTGEVE